MHTLTIDARMIEASGIGNYLQNLIPFFIKKFNTYLIGNPELLSKYSWAENATIIPCVAPIYSLKEQIELSIKIPKCDIFWSPHYNIPLLPIKAKKRLVTMHDAYHLAYRHTFPLPQQLYAKVMLKAAATRSDKVITVSNFSKNELSKYTSIPREVFTVVYPGIDTKLFKKHDKEQAKHLLQTVYPGLPENFILYVGNVKPHKNLITLLQAYTLLQQEYKSPFGLVIVGKREGFITGDDKIAAKLKEDDFLKDNVYFTGFVENEYLPLIYNSASLFVFPSIYEGFGTPPLEAMACGCPVIASNAASIPEISGPAALLFNPTDAVDLKEKLHALLTNKNKLEELRQSGQEHVRKFPWKTTAEKHIQIVEELISS
ncbi:glycosyltransferase family 4 protein [Botryobacter ruber]|uniref:glycosyltransferase family 4 protein n=1 Tax=Botryobacter ruber TaxID=2171629 RepID=UPI00196B7582|nr:glycosyltransferase family 1 protein [Botryobacter ruber]